jgi:hypothetical protein
LDGDVLAIGAFEALGLTAESHDEPAIVLLLNGGDSLEEGERVSPFNVVTRGVLKNLAKGVVVVATEMYRLGWRCHRGSSFRTRVANAP